MHANKCSIKQTFSNHPKLEIPFFQRKYVWTENEWKDYWNTMVIVSSSSYNNLHDYFMGAIVLKQESTSTLEGDVRAVIDGQQRLITTFLFFKAICVKNGSDDFFNDYFYKRIYKPSERKKILQVSRDDEEVFNKIMEGRIVEIKETEKKNKIYQCFEFFSNKTIDKINELNLDRMIDCICFVVIDLDEKQDEQQIFDTINSLGVRLTTAELVKNYLFRGRDENNIKDYEKFWQDLFDGEGHKFWDHSIETGRGKKPNIEVFFQAFFDIYNTESQSAKYDSAGSLANKYKIFFKDKKIKQGTAMRIEFLKSLKKYAEIYRENINKILLEGMNFSSFVYRTNIVIHAMNNTTILPYILYVLKNVSDKKERDALFLLVESYMIRRTICKLPTNAYNKFFPWLVQNEYKKHKKLNSHFFKLMKENNPNYRFPSNEQFWNNFDGNEGGISNKNARAILYLIEQSLFDDNHGVQLLRHDKYQIEHILPKKWQENWGDFGSNIENFYERDNYLNQYINKMGNLTILAPKPNIRISNANWENKKKGYSKHQKAHSKGLLECAKSIKSFDRDEYLKSDVWDEDRIDSRTKFLFGLATKIWPEPSESNEPLTLDESSVSDESPVSDEPLVSEESLDSDELLDSNESSDSDEEEE